MDRIERRALVSVKLEDVNEFSPEFERPIYSLSYELDPDSEAPLPPLPTDLAHSHNHHHKPAGANINNNNNNNHHQSGGQEAARRFLLQVRAHDHDCSVEFGSVCRYELAPSSPTSTSSSPSASPSHSSEAGSGAELTDGLSVDSQGRIWLQRVPARWRQLVAAASSSTSANQQQQQQQPHVSFQVLAYDCAGRKSQRPATVQLALSRLCRPALRGKCSLSSLRPVR